MIHCTFCCIRNTGDRPLVAMTPAVLVTRAGFLSDLHRETSAFGPGSERCGSEAAMLLTLHFLFSLTKAPPQAPAFRYGA